MIQATLLMCTFFLYDRPFPYTDDLIRQLFRWLFIPWVQKELDAYMLRLNQTKKRYDRNKILPHGPPNDIYNNPELYGAMDFKVRCLC